MTNEGDFRIFEVGRNLADGLCQRGCAFSKAMTVVVVEAISLLAVNPEYISQGAKPTIGGGTAMDNQYKLGPRINGYTRPTLIGTRTDVGYFKFNLM